MLKVTLYSTNTCPYCDRAKALLKSRGLSYDEVSLQDDPEGLQHLIQKTGQRTVPQIFINDIFIGGFTDLLALDREKALNERDSNDFS